LHGILQVGGDLFGERDHQVSVQGGGNTGEGVETVAGAAALLETGDDRLRGAHPLIA
jgi:hypothetical protein